MDKPHTDVYENMVVRVIRSDRKTVCVAVEEDLSVTVRAPRHMPEENIRHLLIQRAGWVEKHRTRMQQHMAEQAVLPPLTEEERRECRRECTALLHRLVPLYAARMGVTYTSIRVRFQKTRFGSCSSGGALSFHGMLCRMPETIAVYVVVHELCHRKHMDHSAAFWAEVQRHYPDCQSARRWLREHGDTYIRRARPPTSAEKQKSLAAKE